MITRRRFGGMAIASNRRRSGCCEPARCARKKLENLGSTVPAAPPEAFLLCLEAEMAKWGPIIRHAHITIDD
jgi:hypothetical protein